MRQIRGFTMLAGMIAVGLLLLATPGCATSDRDKLLQFRESLATTRDAALLAREQDKLTPKQYLAINNADKKIRVYLDAIEAKVRAGDTIEAAVWAQISQMIADLRAAAELAEKPKTVHAGMSTLAAMELVLLILKGLQSAGIAGRKEIDPETETQIREHEALSIARADAQADKDAAELAEGGQQ